MADVLAACFHRPMGKHAAPDEAPDDPLVVDPRTHREVAEPGAHHSQPRPGEDGPLGWPERTVPHDDGPHEDPSDDGIGWPAR